MSLRIVSVCLFSTALAVAQAQEGQPLLRINEKGYYEGAGAEVMMFDDFYPEGHQGGLTIVQCGRRIAGSGDLRLEATPGQWSPVPAVGTRVIDRETGSISVELWYPDSSRNRQGFNPIDYPDLMFRYVVRTEAVKDGIRVLVDLEKPLPALWAGKVGFNLELFPGAYFAKHFILDGGRTGAFPRQANGPTIRDKSGTLQVVPLATGRKLVIAPGDSQATLQIQSKTGELHLIDGRGLHNNGWFIVRSTIPAGAARGALEWIITPAQNPNWRRKPVIQLSQVGYHPAAKKFAVIELDKSTESLEPIKLIRIEEEGEKIVEEEKSPTLWGSFLRYKYSRFDFSGVKEEGIYIVRYGQSTSGPFEIRNDIYARHLWQPSLETFLPVQMCHMRVEDRYKVWHGLCHMDDALMAPINHNHFDGYIQHKSTLTRFGPGDRVPGLNAGGWHDAGDYDLRIESQAETMYKLALMYEFFGVEYDETKVDQVNSTVSLHTPDGIPDILQHAEHGALWIVGAYRSLGRLPRGVISPTLKQYVHLGDAATMSDNLPYVEGSKDPILGHSLPKDDRLVFTEENPRRELGTAQALAAAGRVLQKLNPGLSASCLQISEELYRRNESARITDRINAAGELYLTTLSNSYRTFLLSHAAEMANNVIPHSEILGRVAEQIKDEGFTRTIRGGVRSAFRRIVEQQTANPYGVPYEPRIWGAGWDIQGFGASQVFLHLGFPGDFPSEYAFNALNFVLGCHPGENTVSFVSGVGAHSLMVAYGTNRDEWSYIPGGVGSGTALIRPDLPELKEWPYFWQQSEYVLGGGTLDFMILATAADYLFR